MIAGRRGFPREEFGALKLRSAADDVIEKIKTRRGYRPRGAETWPCQVCGKGNYRDLLGGSFIGRGYRVGGPASDQDASFHVHVCDHCNHGGVVQSRLTRPSACAGAQQRNRPSCVSQTIAIRNQRTIQTLPAGGPEAPPAILICAPRKTDSLSRCRRGYR